MRLRAVALVAVVVLVQGPGARAAEILGYGLRLEAGAEHDSNPVRLETVAGVPAARPIVASPALRLVSAGDLQARVGQQHLLSVSGGLAGKLFLQPDAQPEDLLIADARVAFQTRLRPRWGLGLDVAYYDVFQRAPSLGDARDFRSATPSIRLEHALAAGSIALGGGWRWFTFKPEASFDFRGPNLLASFRHSLSGNPADAATPGAQWDFDAGGGLELRQFGIGACPSIDSCPPPAGSELRQDRFWSSHLDVSRTGAALLGAGLFVGANDSNSYGESLLRLAASVRGVWLLPWQLSLATRAELVATRYREAVPVGHDAMTGMFISVEEEGRSTVRLELVRPIGSVLELGARYTFYVQAPGAGPVRFRRQIVLGYVAFARGS